MEIINENASLVDITWSPLPGFSGSPLIHVIMVRPLSPVPEGAPSPSCCTQGPRWAEVPLKANSLPEAS